MDVPTNRKTLLSLFAIPMNPLVEQVEKHCSVSFRIMCARYVVVVRIDQPQNSSKIVRSKSCSHLAVKMVRNVTRTW